MQGGQVDIQFIHNKFLRMIEVIFNPTFVRSTLAIFTITKSLDQICQHLDRDVFQPHFKIKLEWFKSNDQAGLSEYYSQIEELLKNLFLKFISHFGVEEKSMENTVDEALELFYKVLDQIDTNSQNAKVESQEMNVGKIMNSLILEEQVPPQQSQQSLKQAQLLMKLYNIQQHKTHQNVNFKFIQQWYSIQSKNIFYILSQTAKTNIHNIITLIIKLNSKDSFQAINQVINQLTSISNLSSESPDNLFLQLHSYYQLQAIQEVYLMMILFYKALEEKYNSFRRLVLKRIFNELSSKHYKFLKQPIKILIAIERINLKQQSLLLKHLRQQENPNNQLSKVRHQVSKQLIKYEKLYQKKVNLLNIYRLSDRNKQKHKVINIVISGFLSEDSDKIVQWKSMIDSLQGQTFGIVWGSQTIKKTIAFLIKQISAGVVSSLLSPLKILKFINVCGKVYKGLKSNPFVQAAAESQMTGEALGEIIMNCFEGYLINLIGFSLGTQVIVHTLKVLYQKDRLGMLNNVVTIGGAAQHKQFTQILINAKQPLSIINLNSQNDWILKYLLRGYKFYSQPIGLYNIFIANQLNHPLLRQNIKLTFIVKGQQCKNGEQCKFFKMGKCRYYHPIQHYSKLSDRHLECSLKFSQHLVKHIDCSPFINGHMGYRSNMKIVCQIIKVGDI